MDKLRAEVSQLLESIEARHEERLSRAQSPDIAKSPEREGRYPSRAVSPVKRAPARDLHYVLVGLRGALREAERRNAALTEENAALGRRLATAEREVETRRLIERSYSETARMQRQHLRETAEMRREISRLRDEREKMLSDISSLMGIIRRRMAAAPTAAEQRTGDRHIDPQA
jgi:hypothetical protein